MPNPGNPSVIVDERSFKFSGDWVDDGGPGEFKSTTRRTDVAGSQATYTFQGTSVEVYGTVLPNSAVLTFQIDGTTNTYTAPSSLPPDVDCRKHELLFSSSGLSDGSHTLVMTQSSTHRVFLDYLVYTPSRSSSSEGLTYLVDDTDKRIRYDKGWEATGQEASVKHTVHESTGSGAKLSFGFEGVEISVIAAMQTGDSGNVASISIDGGSPSIFTQPSREDHFDAPFVANLNIFNSGQLAEGKHTLSLTTNGAVPLLVDYFLVTPGRRPRLVVAPPDKTPPNPGSKSHSPTGLASDSPSGPTAAAFFSGGSDLRTEESDIGSATNQAFASTIGFTTNSVGSVIPMTTGVMAGGGTDPSEDGGAQGSKVNAAAIGGGVVGGIAALLVIGVLLCCLRRRRQAARHRRQMMSQRFENLRRGPQRPTLPTLHMPPHNFDQMSSASSERPLTSISMTYEDGMSISPFSDSSVSHHFDNRILPPLDTSRKPGAFSRPSSPPESSVSHHFDRRLLPPLDSSGKSASFSRPTSRPESPVLYIGPPLHFPNELSSKTHSPLHSIP